MQLGILTYHKSHNYGALLQAIGLRLYLENLGHTVYFIDYWPDYHKKMYKNFSSFYTSKGFEYKIKGLVEDIFLYPLKNRRIRKFNRFIQKYITPYTCQTSEQLDCIICGSDQIWRKQAGLGEVYNPMYFGHGDFNAKTFIAYAGSMGEINITKNDELILKRLLTKFQAISVRENALVKFLNKIGFKNIVEVADPTILLGSQKWEDLIKYQPRLIQEEYVLYYNLMGNSFNENIIKGFANDKHLKLVVLDGTIRKNDYLRFNISDADPFEMLNLIAHASIVFTSSYHGLVFSLLFSRQVYCAFNRNKVRAQSLLEYLGIPQILIDQNLLIPEQLIDYSTLQPKLELLRRQSGEWLKEVLSNISKNK